MNKDLAMGMVATYTTRFLGEYTPASIVAAAVEQLDITDVAVKRILGELTAVPEYKSVVLGCLENVDDDSIVILVTQILSILPRAHFAALNSHREWLSEQIKLLCSKLMTALSPASAGVEI